MKRSKLNFAWKDSRLRSKLLGYHLTDGWIYRSAVYLLLVAIAYVFLYPVVTYAFYDIYVDFRPY
jgi:hypothetical protein